MRRHEVEKCPNRRSPTTKSPSSTMKALGCLGHPETCSDTLLLKHDAWTTMLF